MSRPRETFSLDPTPAAEEAARLEALYRLDILDTPPEPEFDELVQLAAAICEAPIGIVSLIDESRQWFKASVGMDSHGTSRDVAFCDHTIRGDDLLLVEDATADARFAANPLVTGDIKIRFYAGMPLHSPDGFALGSLCVIDRVPRRLTPSQLDALRVISRQVNARLELRQQRIVLECSLRATEAARAQLAASEARFHTFMDSAPFLSFLKDADGRYLFYNRLVAETFGISSHEWLGKSDADIFPAELAAPYRAHDLEVLKARELRIVEETTRHGDGTLSQWRSYKFPCIEGDSIFVGGVSVDISKDLLNEAELHRYQKELEYANTLLRHQATTDSLTGLPNRRAAQERLAQAFAQARHTAAPLSVLLLDVDDFKQCNDRHGHDAGDRTLCHLAGVLRNTVRLTDFVARFGGEEFLIILPETTENEVEVFGRRLCTAIRDTVWPVQPMTVSGGIAALSPGIPTQERLITLADEALYLAKRSGKNRILPRGAAPSTY